MGFEIIFKQKEKQRDVSLAIQVSEAKEENQLKNKLLEFFSVLFGFLLNINTKLFQYKDLRYLIKIYKG